VSARIAEPKDQQISMSAQGGLLIEGDLTTRLEWRLQRRCHKASLSDGGGRTHAAEPEAGGDWSYTKVRPPSEAETRNIEESA